MGGGVQQIIAGLGKGWGEKWGRELVCRTLSREEAGMKVRMEDGGDTMRAGGSNKRGPREERSLRAEKTRRTLIRTTKGLGPF